MASALIGQRYSHNEAFDKNIRRGLIVFTLGLGITLVTVLTDPDTAIWFGILHLLGISIWLSSYFMRFKWLNLGFAAIFIWLGTWFAQIQASSLVWIPLGATPAGFRSLDYYPLLPWFAVVLIGIAVGNFIYEEKAALLFLCSKRA